MDLEILEDEAQDLIDNAFEEFCVKEIKWRKEDIAAIKAKLKEMKKQYKINITEKVLRSKFVTTDYNKRY